MAAQACQRHAFAKPLYFASPVSARYWRVRRFRIHPSQSSKTKLSESPSVVKGHCRQIDSRAWSPLCSAKVVRILIRRRCVAPAVGFSVAQLEIGRVYGVSRAIAEFLINNQCAEPYPASEAPDRLAELFRSEA